MNTVTLEEAQDHLAEIIDGLSPGQEVVVTRDAKPIATIRQPCASQSPAPRTLGTLKGTVLYMAPDFDAIPEGFEEYVS